MGHNFASVAFCMLQRIICIFKHFHSALGIIKSDANCSMPRATYHIRQLQLQQCVRCAVSDSDFDSNANASWGCLLLLIFLAFLPFLFGCVHTEMQLSRQAGDEGKGAALALLTLKILQLTGHVARGGGGVARWAGSRGALNKLMSSHNKSQQLLWQCGVHWGGGGSAQLSAMSC